MDTNSTLTKIETQTPIYRTGWFWGTIIGVVLIIGGAIITFSRVVDATPRVAGDPVEVAAPIAGHPAPDFALKTLDGETIRLSDYKGQPVLINFWATWCGPCRAEFPDFQEAAVENEGKLVIIGINNTRTDQVEQIPEFLEEFKVTYPIVLDTDGEAADAYEIIGLPTSIFVNSEGIVNEIFTGPINKAYIESKIEELNDL